MQSCIGSYVLMRKDTANAMPIVIASSLLIVNLAPELGLVSSDSSANHDISQAAFSLETVTTIVTRLVLTHMHSHTRCLFGIATVATEAATYDAVCMQNASKPEHPMLYHKLKSKVCGAATLDSR